MRVMALFAAAVGLLHGDTRCAACHDAQVKSWLRSGMARSISEPATDPGFRSQFTHALSGTTFRVSARAGKPVHEASRNGRRVAYVPEWVIGSGNQGRSYVHRIQDALFQSPISLYSERRAYDMSPGFAQDVNPDFFRPVTAECLFCHSGGARPVAGTQNRYLNPPFQPSAIGCDRCHGDPAAHLASPNRRTILNPARLAPDHRDAVCEQCHLSGEARIPNPGREFADFRPGMRLEDAFTVFVRQNGGSAGGLKVVSHSEQLALSRCFVKSSPDLWCGTCHNPHGQTADKVAWYRAKCVGCHSTPDAAAHEARNGRDCAGCHMPRLKAYDGGHTAFTDHWIRARPEKPSRTEGNTLRAWRAPPASLRDRNTGLAYISSGLKNGDASAMTRGFELLGSEPADGAVETARGMMLLRQNKPMEAVRAFRRAVEEQPRNSLRRYNLAVALFAAGDRDGAMRNVEEAVALEPLLEDAYVLAAEVEPQRASEWKRRYLNLAPQRFLP